MERAIAAEARIEEEERERQAKRPRHEDLDLSLLVGLDEPEDASTLAKELSSIATQHAQKGIIPADDETGDAKAEERATKALENEFKNVGVLSRAKVTTNRVYSAVYHPDENKDLIFFGGALQSQAVILFSYNDAPADKAGMLGIWDAAAPASDDTQRNETSEDGKYWRLQLHWPATTKSVRHTPSCGVSIANSLLHRPSHPFNSTLQTITKCVSSSCPHHSCLTNSLP